VIVAPGGLRDSAGIGRLVTSITRYWRECGGPPHRVVDSYGPARLLLTPFFVLGALWQIGQLARRGQVALVHIHMATRSSILRKAVILRFAHRLAVPVILHLHGNQFDTFYRRLPAALQRFVRETIRRADTLIVLGERWRGGIAGELGIDPRQVNVVYNAVTGPATLPRRQEPPRMLFLGRLSAAKGVPELLDALAAAELSGLQWRARLAGTGDAHAYRRRAAAAGLAERVEICGWAPEPQVRQWLAEADIFVLPSHGEGMSMAVLEAMAFGLAVITTPVGANEEAVVDGETGLVIPVGATADLTAALARLISDGALRRKLQIGARRRFEEKFDIAKHSLQLQALYDDTVARRGR
jgi:glycosyltransferase involved in cell wall biosynthesis